jgi:hypothetical protein
MQDMSGFNDLEKSILGWYMTRYKSPTLRQQLETARFVRREWTKVGYYTEFEVQEDLPPVKLPQVGGGWPVHGPFIRARNLQYGGSVILWGQGGYANCIEMYAYGDLFPEELREFELVEMPKQQYGGDASGAPPEKRMNRYEDRMYKRAKAVMRRMDLNRRTARNPVAAILKLIKKPSNIALELTA